MSEASAVQNPPIKYAAEIGWEKLSQSEAEELRQGQGGQILVEIVRRKLLELNPGVVTEKNIDEILRDLGQLHPSIRGNERALSWIKGQQTVFVEKEKRERSVNLIDFDHPDRNEFHVTAEWIQSNHTFTNRADIVFLINGVPVAVAEAKNAGKADGLAEAIDQLRRYHTETPEMVTHAQLIEATELVRFYYGTTWNVIRRFIFNWKDEMPKGDESFERKIKTFFDRARFLNVLKNYVFFQKASNGDLTKIVLRQHQTRAVEKVLSRAAEPLKKRGLIWHTQGSGKTLTMITIAARLLRDRSEGEKPTVLMLIDRNELEGQLNINLDAFGFRDDRALASGGNQDAHSIGTYRLANSKDDIQDILSSDYRGLVVSMIHKFDRMPADINKRENIIVLVDEAHRTTGGDFGTYLMAALPKATYIGFTGTPIDKISRGKGTFKVFGVDDEQGFLDKYSIAEAIEDGTTVALNYALAPSELLVNREILEKEFLSYAEAQGISDIDEMNAILDRAVELKEMMKTPSRIDRIAGEVAKHFTENVEPMGFKAFLVAVDREACALYKKALDKHLPPEYSAVVFSSFHNDRAEIKQHHLTKDKEDQIRQDFRAKGKNPKILIVTEKLLTGYDAPILYCMYLDKPMRDHVLLQSIARVNRPYEDGGGQVKPYGFVLDFVGIFEKLEKALAFDSDFVASVIQNIDVLKQLFATMMKEQGAQYLPLAQGWDDKSKDRAIQAFEKKESREKYFTFFRQIQNLYDVLSPDVFLRPYIDDFARLSELYGLVRSAYADKTYVDRELTRKTKELLRQHTDFTGFSMPNEIYKLGARELELIRDDGTSATTKILNLKKLLATAVRDEGGNKPFLISIAERADKLKEAYEDRQLTTQEALDKFLGIAGEVVAADEEQKKLGLDANTFAIYATIKPVFDGITPKIAKAIDKLFETYPEYAWNQNEQRQLRQKLYHQLHDLGIAANMIDVANSLLRLQRVKRNAQKNED